jgi:pimeloyl-ACP methyl ester carboxylesterase
MFKRQQLPYNKTFGYEGAKINYEVMGKGKPVIMIHGSFTNTSNYKKTIHLLSKYYSVYSLDFPGFGASDIIQGRRHDIRLFTDVLTHFLHKHKLTNAPIIALSLGVVIAAKAALKRGTRGKLIMVGAPGKTDTGLMTQISGRLPIVIKRLLLNTQWGRKNVLIPTASASTGKTNPEEDKELLRHLAHTDSKSIADIDYLGEFNSYNDFMPEIKNEMVFMYGADDKFKEVKIPFIKDFIEIPASGHNIFVDAPEESVRVLRRIL